LSDPRIDHPIYVRITVNKISKEISVQRSWPLSCWNAESGHAIVKKKALSINAKPKRTGQNEEDMAISMDDQARELNAYLDTLQAKVFEAKHRLIESGKPVTAEGIKNIVQGRDDKSYRPHLLLEIFQYHNDQVKALIGSESEDEFRLFKDFIADAWHDKNSSSAGRYLQLFSLHDLANKGRKKF
jgi:hypothetical protein